MSAAVVKQASREIFKQSIILRCSEHLNLQGARWSFFDCALGSAERKIDLNLLKESANVISSHSDVHKSNILGKYCDFIQNYEGAYPEGIKFGLDGRPKNKHYIVSEEDSEDLREQMSGHKRVNFVVEQDLARSIGSIIPRSRSGLACFDTTRFDNLNLTNEQIQQKVGKIAQETIAHWPAATVVVTYPITKSGGRPMTLMDRAMHGGCNRMLMAEIYEEGGDDGIGVCVANPPSSLKDHLKNTVDVLAELTEEGEKMKSRISWLTPFNFDDINCPDGIPLEHIFCPPELHAKAPAHENIEAYLEPEEKTIEEDHINVANRLADWKPTPMPPKYYNLYKKREHNAVEYSPATPQQSLSDWYFSQLDKSDRDARDTMRMHEWIRLNKKFK